MLKLMHGDPVDVDDPRGASKPQKRSPVVPDLTDIVEIVREGQPTALLELYGVDLDLRPMTIFNVAVRP